MRKNRFQVCKLLLLGFLLLFVCSIDSYGQKVSGKVLDAANIPLPGVTVAVKNSSNGTITDLNGAYEVNVANIETDILIFSYIGMETQEIAIAGNSQIDVVLQDAATTLNEVVAIGYGTAKKKDITGSVSSIQGKDLSLIPVSSAAEAMTGKMAGVQVTTTEGSPDAEIKIRVRGGGSITQDNAPLYIVDGFPVSSISDIPSSQIQSIDVLKDASSTAIYGARGANGVIIITTKSGTEGKLKVSYNAYYGQKKAANSLTNLGVEDYVNWQYEMAALGNDISTYTKYFGQYQDIDLYSGQPSNDWYQQVFGKIGSSFSQDLTVSGGTEKFKYSLSYAGLINKEIMLESDFNRNNVALKLDHNPSKRIGISFNLRYSDSKVNGGGAIDQSTASPQDAKVKMAMVYSPIPLTGLGEYGDDEFKNSFVNPITAVYDGDRQQSRKRFNMGASFSWKILEDLEFRTEGGLDNNYNLDDRYYGLTAYYVKNTPAAAYQNMPAGEYTDNMSTSIRNTNTLNYNFSKLFNNTAHSLKVLLGQEYILTQSNTTFNQVHGFPTFFASEDVFKLASQGYSAQYTNTYNPDNKLLSFFGRANYDFKGRYLLSATFRADGSSKFGNGNKWGYFPSVAGAWRISEEGFMDGTKSVIDNLKLRLSYGTAGNNNIPANQISQIFVPGNTTYINNASQFWSPSSTMANPDLKWETTYTRNAGLDFGLLNNKLTGTAELYYNTTKDLLINFPVAGTGYNTQYRNMGETENKGLELSLNWAVLDKEKYGLNIGFNIGFNKNKINSLGIMKDFGIASGWSSTEISSDYWISVGGSVGKIYGYTSDGRYEVSDFSGYDAATNKWILNDGVPTNTAVIGTVRPGSMKLKDINEDGVVDVNDNTIIGDANPNSTGGFNIDGRFYGFDVSAAFSWSYGNDIYNANKIEYTTGRYQYRNMIDMMATGTRWNNIDADGVLVNDPTTLASMNENTTMWSPYSTRHVLSDWAVEDGSFLRLNTLSLGYTIPKNIVEKVRIQNLRFYVSCYNVFILTNYTGFDPEVSTRRGTALTPGVDYSAYPKSRQLLFGLNLSF